MARSHRKRPFAGITAAPSDKAHKTVAHRRSRRVNNQILATTFDDSALKHRRETSDPWSMAKDGKLRFDPGRHPRLLRK